MSNYVKYNRKITSTGWAAAQEAPFRFTGSSNDGGWYPMIQVNCTNGKYIIGLYAGSIVACRILDSQPSTPQYTILGNQWSNVW